MRSHTALFTLNQQQKHRGRVGNIHSLQQPSLTFDSAVAVDIWKPRIGVVTPSSCHTNITQTNEFKTSKHHDLKYLKKSDKDGYQK